MRVLYLYCHPLPESFHAAIRAKALDGLRAAGHEVDLLDLYADRFDPVLSEDARRHWMALTMGDPPRKIVKRYLRWFVDRRARVDYHALYHMNVATEAQRTAFMEKIRVAMTRLG